MTSGEVDLSVQEFLKELPSFSKKGITEFALHDKKISSDKSALAEICRAVKKSAPDLFLTLQIAVSALDKNLVHLLQDIYCSIEIPLSGTEKGANLLFDKKIYSSKAQMLNTEGLVFGFDMAYGIQPGDSFKAFRDRLDFAVTLYPNHIDFAQLQGKMVLPRSTGIYSSKDLEFSREMAFACQTFYSAGRAVPWFNSVVKSLKISPTAFFADFSEWQRCNNCSLDSDFRPDDAKQIDVEKMQLNFLKQKYEEKHKSMLYDAAADMVRLNGAFSRMVAEGEESIVETRYNPDDILSPYSMDIARFAESATMESCRVKIFSTDEGPDYEIIGS
ncbi:MAG TPA: hypothetical protein DCZ74_07505 [Treponema sp.]|nr:hypothetical protein [Treponema sp.]